MATGKNPETFEEYKIMFPEKIRKKLEQIRNIVRREVPEAEEKISYGMPAFTYNGMLLYYAAHTSHIGFYPFTTAVIAFKEELTPYKTSKGTIQFPHNKPLPLTLIAQIVRFRALENLQKTELKKKKKLIID